MIEALSANATNESFREWILPRTLRRCEHLCSAKNASEPFGRPMLIITELLHFAEPPDLIHILLTP
jgi:hypothetical protein